VRLCGCAAACGSASGSVHAVRTAVCAMCSVVYGSARGSVRQCGSAVVCGSAVRQSMRLCAAVRVVVCGSACMTVRYECL
jgi:hypothetical protein